MVREALNLYIVEHLLEVTIFLLACGFGIGIIGTHRMVIAAYFDGIKEGARREYERVQKENNEKKDVDL
jgi:hypothetical protein